MVEKHKAILEAAKQITESGHLDPALPPVFRRLGRPLCHRGAEDLVRKTLLLPPTTRLTDVHIKRAFLVASLMDLRQSVGSCFATAPAILIHDEQKEVFYQDLYDLLSTGRLKRVFGGVEYTVPLNLQAADLLKAWEYTLASFAEVQTDFARWNLSLSLGLDPREEGGIGHVLYESINQKLDEANRKMQEHQIELIRATDELRSVESLLKQAGSESEARRLRAEFQGKYYHMQSSLDLRDRFHALAKQCVDLFSTLTKRYGVLFQEHFHEVYDPSMQAAFSRYGDSPAGFRLVYKHGRNDPSVWSFIHSAEEFSKALSDFFILTETDISAQFESEEEKAAVSEVVSTLIQHVRTEEFIHSALKRCAEKGRKPWEYISGSTMDQLLKIYFCREGEFTKESRWVESVQDLLIFLLDTLKALPPRIMDAFIANPSKGMLMHSPTHAFILHPGWAPFCKGWQDNGFTYSWVRDQYLIPALRGEASPLLFADTNWGLEGEPIYFAFVMREQLELWRMNKSGTKGEPMHEWREYLNGSKKAPWVIYADPGQYTLGVRAAL